MNPGRPGAWLAGRGTAPSCSVLPLSAAYGFCRDTNAGFLLFSRQPVTKNTFRQYRVLGKGGFGEVSEPHVSG